MKWSFKYFLKNRAYTKDQFIDYISKTKFKKYEIEESPQELEIWLEKSANRDK